MLKSLQKLAPALACNGLIAAAQYHYIHDFRTQYGRNQVAHAKIGEIRVEKTWKNDDFLALLLLYQIKCQNVVLEVAETLGMHFANAEAVREAAEIPTLDLTKGINFVIIS